MVSDETEFHNICRFLDTFIVPSSASASASASASNIPPKLYKKFNEITVILQNQNGGMSRGERHDPHKQVERRTLIAILRNTLLYSVLRPLHHYVVWLDVDVYFLQESIIQHFIASNKDIITPACLFGEGDSDYDLNAWTGTRTVPSEEQLKVMDSGMKSNYVPYHRQADFVRASRNKLKDDQEYVQLDSVGGTLLVVRAEVHLQGTSFPAYNVIGTTWKRQGWDGIETEGLCFVAGVGGWKCWGAPNWIIRHKIK